MKHCMAVGAYGYEVSHGINDVSGSDFRNGNNVVDMDEPFSKLTVDFFEIKAADATAMSVRHEAELAVPGISFIRVG